MSRRNDYLVRLAAVALGVSLAAGLTAGCGKRGPLERPAPLFGGTPRVSSPVEPPVLPTTGGATTPAAGGQAKPADDNEGPPTTRDIRDPGQVLTPAASAPVPGAPPGPFGAPVSTKSPY